MVSIWIEISGDHVKDSKISAEILGKYLQNTQQLVRNIAKATIAEPKKKQNKQAYRERLQLMVTDFRSGSVKVRLATGGQLNVHGQDFLDPVVEKFYKTIETVKIEKEKEGLEKLQTIFPDRIQRINILQNLKSLWPEKGMSVKYRSNISEERRYNEEMVISYQPRIPRWLNAELKEITDSLIGVITRVKLDGAHPYFYVREEGRLGIKGDITEEIEDQVIERLKKPVRIRGVFQKKRSSILIRNLESLSSVETITITPVEYPMLQKEITLEVDYDGDFYIGTFEELKISIYSETYEGLREEFKMEVEGFIEDILPLEDYQLAPTMQRIRKAYRKYITK